MSAKRHSIAVILAGGSGTRLGSSTPKQLLEIAGEPILKHTLRAFSLCADIDEILLLMHAGYLDQARHIASAYPKVSQVLPGGANRDDSTKIALDALENQDPDTVVLFHDGVRPLVDGRIIADAVKALASYDAVCVCVPTVDTIVEVDEHGEIVQVPDRSRLRRAQTPQGFRLGTISQAYRLACADPLFEGTDNCSVVLKYLPNTPIAVVNGSERNLKITRPIDVRLAQTLLQAGS
ncbi:MAG: 2-C-methyl-D-erythritol 4-phosphate cytidylyltransferase [Propionibacteriaceae bacterium]|nr:2-C-methyl-D-erythritol 4-phosphate cytidylyltransferase [Propionibacteriaceae bacterium]